MQFSMEFDMHGVYGLKCQTEEPSLPDVSGPLSSRLHNDQVRSRDTARSKRESEENAI